MFDLEQAFATIAEIKIREAIKEGKFDNLPGQGKPLQLEDLSLIPEGLRVGYMLLKNAGLLPEELELKKEIADLQRLVRDCVVEGERDRLRKRLEEKMMLYNILVEKAQRNSGRRH